MVRKELGGITWNFGYENVASAPFDAVMTINNTLKVNPVKLCGGDVSWVRRPRLYWLSYEIFDGELRGHSEMDFFVQVID